LRQLAWLVGSGAAATALVLAAFMAGLALGAAGLGPLADRARRPLLLFGVLELGTAVAGASLVRLLGAGREAFLAPLRWLEPGPAQRVAELGLAFLLLLVPTVLMGGTLPALARATIRDLSGFAGSLGRLYGLNTLGGAAGVYLAGFQLFERVGIARSAYLAALVQAAVGLAALALSRGKTRERARGELAAGARAPGPEPETARGRAACLLAAMAGGFAVLGYEVVWTRILSLLVRSFSYSFCLMLALFLLGLCLGASVVPLVAGRLRRPVPFVGWLQVAMGAYAASTLLWLPERLVPVEGSSFEGFLARSGLRAALVVLPPTVLSGMVLPLAARGFARGPGRVGRDVGVVYGSNTAAAIAGALLAGLVLLPALGAPASLALLAAVNAAAGAAVLWLAAPGTLRVAAAALVAAACAVPPAIGRERFVAAFVSATRSAERIGEVLFFHEGAADTVAIVRKDYGFHDREAKSLITNGVAMSATVKPVWRYMALEGHLPAIACRGRERALAIGLGTGITLEALVAHPALRAIDAVELSDGVLLGLDVFAAENARAHRDGRVRLVHDDGRHWLELSAARYDLITLEPPPPIVAGSVHLYSLDFYRRCRTRLAPGGVVAQWLPLHAQSLVSARMLARTFLEAFPHATLWLPAPRDAVLLGSDGPAGPTLDAVLAAYAVPRTRASLERAYLETPEALLATLWLDREGLRSWAAGASVITDERPLMEFFRHQGGNMSDADIGTLLDLPPASWKAIPGLVERPELFERVRREHGALRLHVESLVRRDEALAREAARRSRGSEFFLHGLGCAAAQIDALRAGGGAGPRQIEAHVLRCRGLGARYTASP
jgi:spermidine synthase